jgi:hypothetical protein
VIRDCTDEKGAFPGIIDPNTAPKTARGAQSQAGFEPPPPSRLVIGSYMAPASHRTAFPAGNLGNLPDDGRREKRQSLARRQ